MKFLSKRKNTRRDVMIASQLLNGIVNSADGEITGGSMKNSKCLRYYTGQNQAGWI